MTIASIPSSGTNPLFFPVEFYPLPPEDLELLRQPFTSLTETEKDKIDRLLRSGALVLLPPQINPEIFYQISLTFDSLFSIQKAGTINVSALLKAVALEEHKTISACLDKWIESLAKQAEENKKAQERQTEHQIDAKIQETAEYLKALTTKNQILSSTLVPFIISAATVPAAFASKNDIIDSLSAVKTIVPLSDAVMIHLAGISNGLIMAALSWAAPVAVTLGAFSSNSKDIEKTAVRAHAIAIATFLHNEEFNTHVENKINSLVASGLLTSEQAQTALSGLKTSLLIDSLASLYCAEYGGITKEELRALINGTMSPTENTLIETFRKLVQEQLHTLSEKDQQSLLETCTSKYDYTTYQGLFEPLVQFLSLWNRDYSQQSALAQPT